MFDVILTGGKIIKDFDLIGVTETEVIGKNSKSNLIIIDKNEIEMTIEF